MDEIITNPNEENQENKEVEESLKVQEEPKKKRELDIPKIFKNKAFVFSFLSVLTIFGALLLFLLDDENSFRNQVLGIKPESLAWLRKIFNLNVTMVTWLIFAIITATVWIVAFYVLFRKQIKEKVVAKREAKTGEPFSKKDNIIFYAVFFGIIAVFIGLVVMSTIMLFGSVQGGAASMGKQFADLGNAEQFGIALLTFLKSAAILLIAILLIPAVVVAFLLVYKLIVLLFGGIAGGIAKNVMASTNFQETYAAAQAASNRINEMANQLPKTISVESVGGSGLGGGNGGGGSASNAFGLDAIDGTIFPALEAIDLKYAPKEEEPEESGEALEAEVNEEAEVEEKKSSKKGAKEEAKEQPAKEEKAEEKPAKKSRKDFSLLVDEFQSYLAKEEKLYFSKKVLRTFIAGMSASRLILLEGLSGTGKSSLPRKFQQFIGGKATFLQVQATWRDRSDIIGYFSDLTGYYKETELLKSIYESSYTPSEVNLIVLDEMNISRAEYYFADFLSIYEYPSEDWKVQLMQVSAEMKLPKLIKGGALQIPTNIWFVGTINVDDSTFTVTDKVYDRAIVINFNTINDEFDATFDKEIEPLSYEEIAEFFATTQSDKRLCLTKEDKTKLYDLLRFLDDAFEIKVGNRIFHQIEAFVPVFVGLGGTKLDALDMMIAGKIFRKLDYVFIMEMGDNLIRLQRYLQSSYKKGSLPVCEAKINSLLKKYQ